MKVGVLGSGDVGKALAKGFLGRGDQVMLGSRTPDGLADWVAEAGDGASAGDFAETAAFGELAVLATLGVAALDALELARPENLAGKVLIDATNPLDHSGEGPPRLAFGFDDSLGARVQGAVPDAKVVKAFNTVGNPYMVDPDLPGGPPTMFICGDDDEGKRAVTEILSSFGWDVADLGGIERSWALEAMCMAWVYYGLESGGWDHAFKLLRK
jgi:8-hydroxy-5-deazaflavin:NADPH oxidoreductase